MKRKSITKKTPAKKKIKEDKNQRSLEFYFNKQSKSTNDVRSKESSIKKEDNSICIDQSETNSLTNAISNDNLSNNTSVKETNVQPEVSNTFQVSKKSGLAFNKTVNPTTQSSNV